MMKKNIQWRRSAAGISRLEPAHLLPGAEMIGRQLLLDLRASRVM